MYTVFKSVDCTFSVCCIVCTYAYCINFACIDKLDMDKEAVIYNDDGTVTLDYQK